MFMLCFKLVKEFVCRFMQPVTTGEYPLSMVSFVGNRLPKFTREQSKILTGSFDFIGVNYYTSNYAANIPHSNNDTSKSTYFKDTHVNLTRGDSGTEPYLTSHYQLLAHAAAKLYKTKYQASQKGLLGITLNSDWFVPVSKEKADRDAAQRALDFMFGWYMEPVTKGEYPKSMQSMVGKRLPKFSEKESEQLKGSFDFLGLNYYSSFYAANAPHLRGAEPAQQTDALVNVTNQHDGKLPGPMAASSWLCIYPRFRELLLFIKKQYNKNRLNQSCMKR
ncbi:cyanogenic beta-glucosidase [Lathyrus oleraceus]|uniref:cyanogenic beta-glucosidase n=1 Tax=Pisum sativum TaxID=3888 RepID=UPI0021D22C1E|nr:cyanogenic beta-glucosidase-like [Pisum sativum]